MTPKNPKKLISLSILLLMNLVLFAQQEEENKILKELKKFNIKTYGVINYYGFDWDTDPDTRNAFDTERLNTYIYYDFNENIQFKTEIEFEHAGTGVTMELDKLEEFGEFETEVEAGGAVKIDQVNVLFKWKPWLNFRVGRVKLYMGNAQKLDLPTQYFTGQRSSMENALIPIGWYENGIELLGKFGKRQQFSYQAYLVNGLNSQGFTSANWIKRGYQQRFETINAEKLAVAGRFDYLLPNEGGYVGVSAYAGDANGNRHKNDLKNTKGLVTLFDAHFHVVKENWRINGMVMYGNLQNSDKISQANRNLSNALGVKRTPVAKNALGYYVEGGYDVLSLMDTDFANKKLYLFGRYDFYDSMHETTGDIIDNPRWERSVTTFGANYFVRSGVVLKAHYAINKLGLETDNTDRTFLLGLAFTFKTN
jgi:hypothetical protein